MSGVIAFSDKPNETWVVAGWTFRQALEDTASQHLEDHQMAKEFERAKAINGLHVDSLDADLAARITNAIREVATGILSETIRSGIVSQPYGDERTAAQYREALRQLLQAIPPPEGQKSA